MNTIPLGGSENERGPSLFSMAWIVVAILWPVALLNYLDRQMLAAMRTSVMADIPDILTDENWGFMLGKFKWVYAFLSPVGGYIADRFSRRFTICASLALWSMVTWATGNVTTYDGLIWTRTLMGISEAFYIPAALALIADYHSPATRSRAVGIHQTAIYFGIIVGGFSGYVADAPDYGWRYAFSFTGIFGVLYAIPLFLFLRDKPSEFRGNSASLSEDTSGIDENRMGSPSGSGFQFLIDIFRIAKELLGNASFILLVLCFTLPAVAGWVVKDWMPAILKDKFEIGQGMAGVSATLYVNIASLAAAFLGGYLADRWMRKTIRGRVYVSAIGMTLLIPALFGVGNASTLLGAILFLIIFGIGWGFFDCNNMPILSQIVRPELRATGYGIMNFVSISTGGFADWGFGKLRSMQVPLNLSFGIFASLAVFSALFMLLIQPRDMETKH